MFGTPASSPGFGTPSTPSFSPAFGSSLFSTPFSQQPQQQQPQQQQSPFSQQPNSGFGFQTPFGATPPPTQSTTTPFPQSSPLPFANAQLTTQMAPVAPLPFSLADRDIQAIVDAYKGEPGNPKYAFKHLLFSVTDPAARAKPAGISDIMWAEAMGKLEGMESADRERLWPQLVQSFKDLSERLKLQDEVILSDAERLRMTQSNVKMLQRHFQADTLPWIQRMQQKEQGLQRRLLRYVWRKKGFSSFYRRQCIVIVGPHYNMMIGHSGSQCAMRILEALEGKGCRLPLMKGEAELAEKITALTRQLKGSGAELSKRVHNLLSISRVHANGIGGGGSVYLPGSTKIQEQSLADMQEVLQQQTEAIGRLGNVLKRDMRDTEIIMAEDTEMIENGR